MITLFLLILFLLGQGCNQRPSYLVIKEFESGLKYEQLADLNNGTRVITKENGVENSAEIIVPGDIIWCESLGGVIFGEKLAQKKPADWMHSDWEKNGFFVLNPSKLRMNAPTDAERMQGAVEWFPSREDLEKSIGISGYKSVDPSQQNPLNSRNSILLEPVR